MRRLLLLSSTVSVVLLVLTVPVHAQTEDAAEGMQFHLQLGLGSELQVFGDVDMRVTGSFISEGARFSVPLTDASALRLSVGGAFEFEDEAVSLGGALSVLTPAGEIGAAYAGQLGGQRPFALEHRIDAPWLWTDHGGAVFYRTGFEFEARAPALDLGLRLSIEPSLAAFAVPGSDALLHFGVEVEAAVDLDWFSAGAVMRAAWLTDGSAYSEVGGFIEADGGFLAGRASVTAMQLPGREDPAWAFQLGASVPIDSEPENSSAD